MFSAGVLANIARQIRPHVPQCRERDVRARHRWWNRWSRVSGARARRRARPTRSSARHDPFRRLATWARGHRGARSRVRDRSSCPGGASIARGRCPALARNVRTAWDTVVAFARAMGIVRRTRPAVVVGVGGYASLPALVAGRLLRIPAVIHEADAHPGLANRIAVRLGARPAVSLPDTPLRGAVVTGNPIRPEIVSVERAPRDAADRRGGRWKPGCAAHQHRHARALRPLARTVTTW